MPKMSNSPLAGTFTIGVVDHNQHKKNICIAGESPLTIKVDGRELVTLMTLGTHPEKLVIGYLFNQYLISSIEAIREVVVDWDKELASVTLNPDYKIRDWQEKLKHRIVTSGCGQGTMFSCSLEKLYGARFSDCKISQSTIYALMKNIAQYNAIYRSAGAVHGCALCKGSEVIIFIEDVGRHNAADAIAGEMLLQHISGSDKIFYTTGRLTSEIIMKVVAMRIPIVLSRSGVTHMGMEIAKDLNVTLIARARARSFLVYVNPNSIEFDDMGPKFSLARGNG